MKLSLAAAFAAAIVLTPLSTQAFFVDQKVIDYKLHILECVGLLFSPEHAEVCGGTVSGPFNSISSPGGASGPAAAPKPPVVVPCAASLEGVGYGERVHVAVVCGPGVPS
jgi:hypothetical protein